MQISKIRQPLFDQLINEEADIVICASGYETRSSHLAEYFGKLKARRIVLGFKEHRDGGSRLNNDQIYEKMNFETRELSGNSSLDAEAMLQAALNEVKKDTCKVIIDISSMTRAWHGGLVRTLWTEDRLKKIEANFVYVPALFTDQKQAYPPNEVVAPVKGFSSLNLTDKPTALILGLGNDRSRALGIKEELDPNLTVAFYADPPSDIRYYDLMLDANSDLLEKIDPELKFGYPLHDTAATFNILESVCAGLLSDFRVVLTSLGPKIFGLICFLIATKYPEISVWRVSAGSRTNIEDHKPSDFKIVIESTWVQPDTSC